MRCGVIRPHAKSLIRVGIVGVSAGTTHLVITTEFLISLIVGRRIDALASS
jgi:hypothetical protein